MRQTRFNVFQIAKMLMVTENVSCRDVTNIYNENDVGSAPYDKCEAKHGDM
jgi:hypothetical protein